MMLVASGLGFSIAWVYKSDKLQSILSKYKDYKAKVSQLEEEQESLVRHSNNLQAETLKYSQKTEKQNKRIQSYKDIVQQLEHDKEFIFREYEQFRTEVKLKLQKNQKMIDAYDEVKEKNQKLKIKADKWKIKFHETEKQLQQTEVSYLKVKKENDLVINKVTSSDSGIPTKGMLEWENNYKKLKLKFLALSKEKEHLELEMSKSVSVSANKGGDEAISKLSEEIVLLKRANKALNAKLEDQIKSYDLKPTKDKESVLLRIKNRSKQVDIGRIGKADPRSTDNLRDLKGLGNLIEQKFIAIGINSFQQIANLNEYDQKLLNFFLELPQGKIESEKWVSQARTIVGDSGDNRIVRNLERINFDRIGEASPTQKDNLQSIIGIGPYIEMKLNAIGIFRLEQLAKLTSEDIEEINGIMELAPDHIENDDWVGQARRMK